MKTFNTLKNYKKHSDTPSFFFIGPERNLEKINISEILFIQSIDHKYIIQTTTNQHVVRRLAPNILSIIKKNNFYRCHKHYFVQLQTIESFNLITNEILARKFSIPVHKKYKPKLLKHLKSF